MTDENHDVDLSALPFEESGDSGNVFLFASRSAVEELNSREEDGAWAFLQ